MIGTKSRLTSILFWSVISAAFIGPGTLATASAAGATYGFSLLWALAFATLACIVLQEMAARVSIISNKDLGRIMLNTSKSRMGVMLVAFSVILGCAAYQAGNILGAIAGLALLTDIESRILTCIVGLIAGVLLWYGSIKQIAQTLGVVVAVMGILFVIVALRVETDISLLLKGTLIPSIPAGSEWLVLGLIGTTIVPYNLFLGSGIGQGQPISDMRFGLITSILLGGLVSIAIVIVGTEITEKASFQSLAIVVGDNLGDWAKILMALGLFAAGMTSSITSPLAAAVISKSIFDANNKWNHQTAGYRATWLAVLITGLLFGLLEVKPLPIIVAAQALNGLILPVIAVIIIVKANDITLLTKVNINKIWLNVLAIVILNFVLLIGLNNVFKAVSTAINVAPSNDTTRFIYLQILALPILGITIKKIITARRRTT